MLKSLFFELQPIIKFAKPVTLSENRNYFPSIDILRGFAALSVVVYHVIEHFKWIDFPTQGPLVWFRIGWMGVDLFFVISGFVIGLSALSEIDRHGISDFRYPFMRRRIVRIVPLHYLTCLIFMTLVMPQILFEKFWPNLITHALFMHNLFPGFHGAINGPNWSLGIEMQFYLLMLLITPWIKQIHPYKTIVILILTAWIWRLGCVWLIPITGEKGIQPLFWMSTQLPGCLDEFAAGLLLAIISRTTLGARLLRASTLWSIVAATIAVWLALQLYWPNAKYWDNPFMVIFYRTILATACGLVVFCACTLNHPWWLRLTAPLRYLGTISYGIYLWHLAVLFSLRDLSWLEPQRALPMILILTFCLASVSWHFFEQPFIQRFAKKSP